MQEYLNCSLKTGIYISFPSLDHSDDHDDFSFVQVVAINQKCIGPKQCKPAGDDDDNPNMMTQVSCQQLERMLPFGDASSQQQAEVFIFEDDLPLKIQMPLSPKDRPNVLRWENCGQSELYDSCISLRNPKPLQPDIDLLHPSCPALCLLDALAERGWRGRPQRVVHAIDSELIYDRRQPMAKKRYYQCLLVQAELFQAGVLEFRSGHPQTHYSYMLKFHKLPPENQTMKQLQDYMKTHSDDLGPLLPALPVL